MRARDVSLLAWLAVVLVVAGVGAGMAVFQPLLPDRALAVSPPTMNAYRLDAERVFLFDPAAGASPRCLLINGREQFVGLPNCTQRAVGALVLRAREPMKAKWLPDLGERYGYGFDGGGVAISWPERDGGLRTIKVEGL